MMFTKLVSLALLLSNVEGFTSTSNPAINTVTRSSNDYSELRAVPEFLSTVDPTVLAGGAAAVAAIGIGGAAAASGAFGGDATSGSSTTPVEKEEEVIKIDVSIDYDSAAKLAYDEWRISNDKGDFDSEGFEVFKEIYVESTVGMVKYKEMKRTMERELEAQKKSYESLVNKLDKLENVGWGQQPQNAL